MKICEIWEDLDNSNRLDNPNYYIFKYDRKVTPEEHAELLKKIMASKTCKYCKNFHEDGPNTWCGHHGGRLMDSCDPDFYCGDFEERKQDNG